MLQQRSPQSHTTVEHAALEFRQENLTSGDLPEQERYKFIYFWYHQSKNVIKILISYGKLCDIRKPHPSKVFMLNKRDFICSNLCREIIVK
jgi:hypothetical protein